MPTAQHSVNPSRALLIGSSSDLNGRALGARIDAGEWDTVARVNNPYGDPADVGTRTDIIFACRLFCINNFPQEARRARVISFRDFSGCDRQAVADFARQLGLRRISTGLLAAHWLVTHGASVDIIGYGAPRGVPSPQKIYWTGQPDRNPRYNWDAEFRWLFAQPQIRFL